MKNEYKPKIGTECVLYDKICDGCGECLMCDLDPTKKCDNCGKCLEEFMPKTNEDGFVEIPVEFEAEADNTEENDLPNELKELFAAYGMPTSAPKHEHNHNHNHNCNCEECEDDNDCTDPDCHCHNHKKHNH